MDYASSEPHYPLPAFETEDLDLGLSFTEGPSIISEDPPLATEVPKPSFSPMVKKKDISSSQAHRIVVQSMARESKVTNEGMVNKKTGKTVSAGEYAAPVRRAKPFNGELI